MFQHFKLWDELNKNLGTVRPYLEHTKLYKTPAIEHTERLIANFFLGKILFLHTHFSNRSLWSSKRLSKNTVSGRLLVEVFRKWTVSKSKREVLKSRAYFEGSNFVLNPGLKGVQFWIWRSFTFERRPLTDRLVESTWTLHFDPRPSTLNWAKLEKLSPFEIIFGRKVETSWKNTVCK